VTGRRDDDEQCLEMRPLVGVTPDVKRVFTQHNVGGLASGTVQMEVSFRDVCDTDPGGPDNSGCADCRGVDPAGDWRTTSGSTYAGDARSTATPTGTGVAHGSCSAPHPRGHHPPCFPPLMPLPLPVGMAMPFQQQYASCQPGDFRPLSRGWTSLPSPQPASVYAPNPQVHLPMSTTHPTASSPRPPIGQPASSPSPATPPPSGDVAGNASQPDIAVRDSSTTKHAYRDVVAYAEAHGFPVGPIQVSTKERFKEEILRFTTDSSRTHCGFGVRFSKHRPASSSRGSVRELVCGQHDSHECMFAMKYEYTLDGWVLIGLQLEHSHALETSTPAVMSLGSARHIPLEYNDLGILLARSRLPAKLIMRVMWTKSVMDGVPEPLFNRQDVYNRFVRTTTQDKELDARNLVSVLATRKAETGLCYDHVSDSNDGGLSRLFVV